MHGWSEMNESGAETERKDLLVRSRAGLLDALEGLAEQREAVVIVGSQAIYLRTKSAPVALAEATKDSDIALDPRDLRDDPLVETSMKEAGFQPNLLTGQPGAWVNSDGIPVDLMVAEALAGGKPTSRGARIPPHDSRVARKAAGLEAAMVDNSLMQVGALDETDDRVYTVKVAGSAALVVAKLHKIGERAKNQPRRLLDKDAHDLYRVLIDTETEDLANSFRALLDNETSRTATDKSLAYLREHFAQGPDAVGSVMAGRAEEGVGEPETVSASVAILAQDLLEVLETSS